jgi:ADP-dependent NAD(P)H-hydrate dehydratase
VSDPVVVTPALLRGWGLPDPGSSKETRGRTLVVGGHVETPGAVLLAAEAALRCGAGKLQMATVAAAATHLAVAMPEGLVRPLPQTPGGAIAADAAEAVLDLADGCAAVLIGPGMADADAVRELLARVVPHLDTTLVLDAAAHAFVTTDGAALAHLHGRCVLTPNLRELALTLEADESEVAADPLRHTRRLAAATGAVVSCGGPQTFVATPDGEAWVDETGGVGLAVSGSGDVHAGIVVGLAARGAAPERAAVWAAHLHGRAGDRLAAAVGPLGFLAREVAAEVPRVLAEIDV